MRRSLFALCAAFVFPLFTAQPTKAEPIGGLIEELRLGVFDHDTGMIASGKEPGYAFNMELRTVSPSFLSYIWSPKPTIGVVLPYRAHTTNHGYAGLTWTFHPMGDRFFVDFFFGLSYNDGNANFDYKPLKFQVPPVIVDERVQKKYVGSHVLFRESLEIGYRLGEKKQHAVSAYISHLSHGQILSKDGRNSGMDHVGVRYGYKF